MIAPLSCSLVETSAVVELRANTLIARAYGRESIEEGYHCRYGVSSAFAAELEQGDLRVTGWDEEGEIRAVEAGDAPVFVATLFQHERHALDGRPRRWCRRFSAPRHNNSTGSGRCRSSSGVNFPVTSGERAADRPSPAKSAPPPAAEYASRHWHHGSCPSAAARRRPADSRRSAPSLTAPRP
ncbi:CTP synthase [Klebsiella pneumoniae]|nr:CTP synthase [Klebsiella pneumoniae]